MRAILFAGCGLVVGMLPASAPVLAADTAGSAAQTALTALQGTGRAETCVIDAYSGCTKKHGFAQRPTSVIVVPAGSALVAVNPAQTTRSTYRVKFTHTDGSRYKAGTRIGFYVHYDFNGGADPDPAPMPQKPNPSAPAPTTKPTTKPTAKPTTKPTGKPTSKPSTPKPTSPKPTATQTTSQPPAPSPDRTCTNPVWSSSQADDGWSTNGYYVHNNMWNDGGGKQTLKACAYNNWYVTATQPNTTSVKTYPNVHKDYDNKPLSSFSSLTSTFAAKTPHTGIYNVAYDIWLNGVATEGSTEVMIWTDNYKQVPSGSIQATVSFNGHTYDVYRSDSHYIAFKSRDTQTSGTMNLKAMFDWLMSKGWISRSSTVGQIDYGVEICSTNNEPTTFEFTDFSIKES